MSRTAEQSSGAAESAGQGPGPFAAEFQRQFERLKRFVMAMGLDVSDAEDVLQDVAVQLLRHEAEYQYILTTYPDTLAAENLRNRRGL